MLAIAGAAGIIAEFVVGFGGGSFVIAVLVGLSVASVRFESFRTTIHFGFGVAVLCSFVLSMLLLLCERERERDV